MREFKFDEHITIVCEWKKTRMAFKHEATLLVDGREQERVKICYQNRTWESYEYQSVLQKCINDSKCLSKEQKEAFLEETKKDHTDWSGFEIVSKIAKLGEIMTTTQKDSNDWKARMLKAGLPDLEMPSDWNSLDEDTKTARLNAVIKVCSNPKGDAV